ncbi:sucrase ferredoxin [Silvanigrella sp.]|jgi:hypothetical protein|uniref:sucrase ferredoxin n=1 Tax=Silvanigrella sp. TaxID=2024976 RepID=UPI0037CB0959
MDIENECSTLTKFSDENIICSVSKLDVQIAIELEEPWDSIPIKSIHYPNSLQMLLPQLTKNKIEFGINYFAKSEYSIQDHTKIFIFKKNQNEFDPYIKLEISLPNEELIHLGSYIINYLSGNNETFDKWKQTDRQNKNEIFICIHGKRDLCCGKYGLNIYNEFFSKIEKNKLNFRVWKSTHIGGHRYAPTFYEAPAMRWYGLFHANDVQTYLNRNLNEFKVSNNYRGMSGISNKYALLTENELFKSYSWEWLKATDKKYEIISLGDQELTEVHFYFRLNSNSNLIKKVFKIEFLRIIEGKSSCNSTDTKSVKQYSVTELSL